MLKVIIIILAVLVLLLLGFSFWLPSYVMTGKRQTLEEARKWQSDRYDISFYDKCKKQEYLIKGFEGYELHTVFLENPKPSCRYMILTHGYTDNRIGSLKYAKLYLDLGYHCVLYDLRGHGENQKDFTTYGIREAKDLSCVIADTRSRYQKIEILGLHGESLGAATTATVMKYQPQVDFAVCDCGFSDIVNVLKRLYQYAHVPAFFVDIADITGKIRYHYSIKDMRPVDSLDGNRIPMLFLHGEEDHYVLPQNSRNLFERTAGYKELHFIPGAHHAQSILTAPELYREIVEAFLKKVHVV